MAKQLAVFLALCVVTASCTARDRTGSIAHDPPVVGSTTPTSHTLAYLAPPPRPLVVAVYEFPDMTGANKPSVSPNYAEFSKAVTQGAAGILVDTLRRVGQGTWFNVVERTRVDNLLRERKLIQDTHNALKRPIRDIYPLHFAEYIVEGGIVGFDSEIVSGGVGASYLGIGADASYLKNLVAVNLRLVNVRKGNVVDSVTATKTIYSVTLSANVSKFVSSDLLGIHAGLTQTEPTQFAVQEAIEVAVLQLINDINTMGLWSSPPPENLDGIPIPLSAEEQINGRRPGNGKRLEQPVERAPTLPNSVIRIPPPARGR
jgi:curli production assembly/transport component CsgG